MAQKLSLRKVWSRSQPLIPAFVLMLTPLSLWAQKNSCLECHLEMEEALRAPAEGFAADIHSQFGLGCQDCHGGNPDHDDVELAKDRTFRGSPERAKIPDFCGSCHSDSEYMRRFNPNLRVDQLTLYWTSRHGQILRKGDPNGAVCTDCHGVHGIQPANFPKSRVFPWNIPEACGRCHSNPERMRPHGLPSTQVDEYKQSVHAQALFEKKDLSAPACNDCHGNHGATPPEVTSIAFVCRQCHPSAGELFSKGPHKAAFDSLGISECEACHGSHKILPPSDAMLAGGREDVCLQCHDADTEPHQTGLKIKGLIDSYGASSKAVEALLLRAERKGVDVAEAKYRLQDASTALVLARNLIHGMSQEEIEAALSQGDKILTELKASGEAALREARFRRTGLVVATLFIVLLAIALYLKIRDLVKPAKPSG